MKKRISAVYKITNTITGDFYIGSSSNVMKRWSAHKYQSTWKHYPNNPMYKDMKKYGVEKFDFQILVPVMPEYLKQIEQEFIETLKPKYNQMNAKGLNVESYRKYQQSEKGKKAIRKYQQSEKGKKAIRKYYQSEKGKKAIRKYKQSEKGKEASRKAIRKYYSKLCEYNGETLTLIALATRFRRAGIPHYTTEAKKYLITAQ